MSTVYIGFVNYYEKYSLDQHCFFVSDLNNIETIAGSNTPEIYDAIDPSSYEDSEESINVEIIATAKCSKREDVIDFMVEQLINNDNLDEDNYHESGEYADIIEIAAAFPQTIVMDKRIASFNYKHLPPVY
jgi:hypothetical protein